MTEDLWGDAAADRYDEAVDPMFTAAAIDPAVDVLAALAGEGSALEFAIGTGRIALPLAARGIAVHGIELSEAMVRRLRAKPGGEAIPVTIADMSTPPAEGSTPASFALVYLVFNTIMNVTTQMGQVGVFRNAAAHLRPGGVFVIEIGIPDLQRLPVGSRFVPFEVADHHLGFDEYDVVGQGLISHHYARREDGRFEYVAAPFRYVWPAELDLMAELAGLKLRDRWADWSRAPLIAESRSHVSVWEKT